MLLKAKFVQGLTSTFFCKSTSKNQIKSYPLSTKYPDSNMHHIFPPFESNRATMEYTTAIYIDQK